MVADDEPNPLTPSLLLRAYCAGIFPMARSRHGPVEWFSPDPRAVIPLEGFHVPRSLRKRLRNETWPITVDRDFRAVIGACAEPRRKESDTWINDEIIDGYTRLHELGYAHSVETWSPRDGRLLGGLYGVAIGGAFFGESMFSRITDASKVCLARLVAALRSGSFQLLDAQVQSAHLEQFHAVEIPRERYLALLEEALAVDAAWPPPLPEGAEVETLPVGP